MRLTVLALIVAATAATPALRADAQQAALTAADSALVGRLLLAEEMRDSLTSAYADGLRHANPLVQVIARRGMLRSRDPIFAERRALPDLPDPPVYIDPAWRLRYRALGAKNENCDELRGALADNNWHVRLRAADLVTQSCANDAALVGVLRTWTKGLPRTAARQRDGISWHAAVHGLTALARAAPAIARAEILYFRTSLNPTVRVYSTRAATTLSDTTTLRKLTSDANDNVKEAAVAGLARVAGHSADDVIIGVLTSSGYQAVRAAATALKATPLRDAALSASIAAAVRLKRDNSETSRDARRALVERIAEFAAPGDWPRIASLGSDVDCTLATFIAELGVKLGDLTTTPHCTPLPITLPADAVRLALGDQSYLRVTMADSSGGGSFIVRLRGDVAPVMAARVLGMAKAGYYNGLTWHRVEPDFVIQGGGTGANEYVGYPRFFRDELGKVPHVRGTLGMSTRGHDTGDGQWFVNLRDNQRLNRDYTIFGEIIEGIDIADGVFEGDVIARMEVVVR